VARFSPGGSAAAPQRSAIDVALDLEPLVNPTNRSSATGEIAVADLRRRAFWAISASSKNAVQPCAQQKAGVAGNAFRPGSESVELSTFGDAVKVLKTLCGMLRADHLRGRSRPEKTVRPAIENWGRFRFAHGTTNNTSHFEADWLRLVDGRLRAEAARRPGLELPTDLLRSALASLAYA